MRRMFNILIDTNASASISDADLNTLLFEVYVNEGFVDAEHARTIFNPALVRQRGDIIAAREGGDLAGMLILVTPHSSARRLAKDQEAELHLLAVKPEFRGRGIGRQLVQAALDQAIFHQYPKILLWTQPRMLAAQRLYQSVGFEHIDDIVLNGRKFFLYELCLDERRLTVSEKETK